jgi:hypothetical protein
VKPTGKECNECEEKGSAAHLVKGLCVKVVRSQRKDWKDCSSVCSTLTGLTAMAIDIAYLYTYASQAIRNPFGGHPEDPVTSITSLSLDPVKLRKRGY